MDVEQDAAPGTQAARTLGRAYRTVSGDLPKSPAADFKPSGCTYSLPPVRTSRTTSSRITAPIVE